MADRTPVAQQVRQGDAPRVPVLSPRNPRRRQRRHLPNSFVPLPYKASLAEIIPDDDRQRSAARVGRLVGVLIKEFANAENLGQPSVHTGAYRAWNLVDESDFDKRFRTPIWQRRAIEIMQQEGPSPSRLRPHARTRAIRLTRCKSATTRTACAQRFDNAFAGRQKKGRTLSIRR